MTTEERKRIEARLDVRLAELRRARAAILASADGDRGSELADVDQHPADGATALHEEELEETERIFIDEDERRIVEARRALADGSYGTCSGCGRPIPVERLQAVPEAIRCLDCQRHFEGRHRQQTPL